MKNEGKKRTVWFSAKQNQTIEKIIELSSDKDENVSSAIRKGLDLLLSQIEGK